jgi:hypothetical protein
MLKRGMILAVSAQVFLGCALNTAIDTSEPQSGTLTMAISNADDAAVLAKAAVRPGMSNIEHVWLTIKKVQAHTSGPGEWATIATPDARFDFLQLVNGVTKPLDLYPLKPGHYTQLRLILSDANEIMVNGKTEPLFVPSGVQSGIKLIRQFTIAEGEKTEICLKFDILKAIHYTPGQGYIMHPTYKTIACDGSAVDESVIDDTPITDSNLD